MSITEIAISKMEQWAADNSHGYDQANRWGPDYDCSSAVISAWAEAGLPVKMMGASYTGNMYKVFCDCGFADVTASVDLYTGAGLERGDVLLNHAKHTAMYCGNGQIVEASINELGGITGGVPGDQTGREFRVTGYRNHPWDCVLRYGETSGNKVQPASKPSTKTPTYWCTVKLPLLKPGIEHPAVEALQILLSLIPNGKMDEETVEAVKTYQRTVGEEPDGEVGIKTWKRFLGV